MDDFIGEFRGKIFAYFIKCNWLDDAFSVATRN